MFCHLISKVCLFAWRDKIKINESNVCSRNLNGGEKLPLGPACFRGQTRRQRCKKHTKVCKAAAHTANMHKHTRNHRALIHIETPFKVDSSGLSVDVENYCSDLTTTCTIKTPACGLGAGIFIPCGNRPYKHTDMQTELQAARNIFIRKHVQCACLPACFWMRFVSAPVPPKHENKQTINTDFGSIFRQIKTLLLWSHMRSWSLACRQNMKTHAACETKTHATWV